MDVCEMNFEVTNHPIFRFNLFYTLVIMIPGMLSLIFLIVGKLSVSYFHGNLKVIMIGYFASIFILAVFIEAITAYMFFHINNAVSLCDVQVDQTVSKYGHMFATFCYTIPMIFPIVITVERAIATRMAGHYADFKIIIGPLLLIFVILFDAVVVLVIYKDEQFEEQRISFSLFQSTSAARLYTFYWILLILNIINIVINLVILWFNKKLNKRHATNVRIRCQLEEVLLSTKFCTLLSFIHTTYFGSNLTFNWLLRHHGELIIEDPMLLKIVRHSLTAVVASFIFFIGPISIVLYTRIKKQRKVRTLKLIKLKKDFGTIEAWAN